jgi:hypothetical protein
MDLKGFYTGVKISLTLFPNFKEDDRKVTFKKISVTNFQRPRNTKKPSITTFEFPNLQIDKSKGYKKDLEL